MTVATRKISTGKLTSIARVTTGKAVTVRRGRSGPNTDGKNINMGKAMDWDRVDCYGVLIHECCHILFPASYPKGNYHQLSNLIDDARIERQQIASAPRHKDALECLNINVICNQKYDESSDEDFKDAWSDEHFDPCLWALLFFRSYLPQDIRLEVCGVMNAYIDREDLRNTVEDFDQKFEDLVREGLRITRLKTVAVSTFQAWCDLYRECFPNANTQPDEVIGVIGILSDQQGSGKGSKKDKDGEGDEGEDERILILIIGGDEEEEEGEDGEDDEDENEDNEDGQGGGGKGAEGKGGKSSGTDEGFCDEEADDVDDLQSKLDDLKESVGKVGTEAENRLNAELDEDEDNRKGVQQKENEDEADEDEDEDSDDGYSSGGIGNHRAYGDSYLRQGCVDKNFVIRLKVAIRKLRQIAIDRVEQFTKSGRLHMPTVMRADRLNLLARRPFQKSIDDVAEVPVAVAVATDFSGSTEGCNGLLNQFMHNALFALQVANCESTGIVWNSGATITKTLDDEVSAVVAKNHRSDGGTSLMAAAQGCVESMKNGRCTRKVAFIFTDGCVYEGEIAPLEKHLKDNGFEAALIVSVDQQVKRKGIVDSATCRELSSLASIFERWVRRQAAKGVGVAD